MMNIYLLLWEIIIKGKKVFKEFQNNYKKSQIVSLIHPSSQVSKNCIVDIGSVVMPLYYK